MDINSYICRICGERKCERIEGVKFNLKSSDMKKVLLLIPVLFCIVAITDARGEDFRRKYRNFSWSSMSMSASDFEGAEPVRSKYGAAFTSGRTYFLHGKPIAGMIKIGLDATWVDLNYNNYSYDWDVEGVPQTSAVHQIEYSLHVGPSIAINPVGKLNINAYFRYAPTFSAFLSTGDGFALSGNYATMFVTGGMVSWGVIGIGAEYRFGNCNYRNLVGDGSLAGNLDKSGFRAFITLRFK